MNTTIKTQKMTRRHALVVLGAGVSSVGALLTQSGCKQDAPAEKKPATTAAPQKPAEQGTNCSAQGGIDEQSKTMRRTLQYLEKSNKAGQNCASCSQYIAAAPNASCGGCKLFTGPVNPNGNCLSFAAVKPAG